MVSLLLRNSLPFGSRLNEGRVSRVHRRGSTLPELLISLMITSLIALSLASILFAAGYGTSSRRDIRRLVVRTEQLRVRLDDAVRNSQCILAAGQNGTESYLVLWQGDATQDGEVNISELQMITLQSGSNTLASFVAATTPNPDTGYDVTADFYTVADQARTNGDLVGTDWSTGVSDFSVSLDDATVTDAKRVTWQATLANELTNEQLIGCASVRAHIAPN